MTASIIAPPIALALARHPAVDDYDLGALRWLGCGAAPLDARIEEACAQRLGCTFGQGYGMTEATATIAVCNVGVRVRTYRARSGHFFPVSTRD